jgi:hypothetical protein
VAAAALTCIAYLVGIAGYALLIRTRSPGRDRASLIDATVISTGVGMLALVFLAAPYSADASPPLVERVLSVLYVVLDVLVLALVIRMAIGGGDRTRGLSPDDRRVAGPGGRRRRAGPAGPARHLRPSQPGGGRLAGRLRPVGRENEATVRELRGTEGVLRASLSERDALAAQLEHQAFHDSLTDLANRALFNDRVRHALARTRRDMDGLAVLFADLDDFKMVNDSLGHGVGDRPGGRARPPRAAPGLPPGGRLGRRHRPAAAAHQPVRPPPAPRRPGRQRGRGPARLRAPARLPGPGDHRAS